MTVDGPATRAAGLQRLVNFAPRAGHAYAVGRNSDAGPGHHQAVSKLSPYLRHRMITEPEVLGEVLRHHTPQEADKFIQEVFWRTYWKGWLEMRPDVWRHYLEKREEDLATSSTTYKEAVEGRTGIDGFDDWARELVTTGYLHNHARMWFASIWIFTLRLPWTLGADFFYQHLLDADPASNTLSWRWVAGLHTRGKTYLARTDNIEKHTFGRHRPSGLARHAEPLWEAFQVPDPRPPRDGQASLLKAAYALLLTSDDLSCTSWPGFKDNPPSLVLTADDIPQERNLRSGNIARTFTSQAIIDAADQITSPTVIIEPSIEGIISACQAHGLKRLVMPFSPIGPVNDWRRSFQPALEREGIELNEIKRRWDDNAWPRATAGFFKLKKAIPTLLTKADLIAPDLFSN